MKYSISNWIYGPEPIEKGFARLAKFGYDGVELVGEPKRINVGQVKELCEKHKLRVTSMAGHYLWMSDENKRDLANPDKEERQKAVEYVIECLNLAKEFGALSFIVVPNSVGKSNPSGNIEKDWERSVEAVKKAAKYAEKIGVFIAIEPVNRYEVYLVKNVDEGLKFAKDVNSSHVKLMLDCFHMNIEEPDPALAIRKAKDELVNLHIADSNRQSVGRGHIDFKAIIRALKEIDYQYSLTMEPLPPLPDPNMAFEIQQPEEVLDRYAEECIELLKMYERVV